jgi:hypothetical protein
MIADICKYELIKNWSYKKINQIQSLTSFVLNIICRRRTGSSRSSSNLTIKYPYRSQFSLVLLFQFLLNNLFVSWLFSNWAWLLSSTVVSLCHHFLCSYWRFFIWLWYRSYLRLKSLRKYYNEIKLICYRKWTKRSETYFRYHEFAGALLYLKLDFDLSDWQQEFVVSAALVGINHEIKSKR